MKKIFLVAAVLLALSGLALAQTSTTSTTMPDGPPKAVLTQATLDCMGNPPTVAYKFELPDDDLVTPGTQVYPVPGGNKDVNVYMIVCDPNGASDIKTVKARVTWPVGGTYVENMGSVVGSYKPILNTAVTAGLITAADRDKIINDIDVNAICKMYKAVFTLDNCDPAGMYAVIATACDDCGCGCLPKENSFQYVSIVAADIDFMSVNYAAISVGNEKKVPGNTVMETPGVAPPVMPTVQNIGNDPMDVVIAATDMLGMCGGVTAVIPVNAQKAIVDASSKLVLTKAGTCFDVSLLCEKPTKIDFFLTPPVGTCATAYSGNVTVTGVHSC